VERRRVYDIINIYQSLDIVKRLARKNYLWNGLGHFVTKLELLMEKTSNPCNEPSQVHRPFEELTTDFIVFMSQSKSSTSLENAAEQFEENFGTAAKKTFKTKVRRLYDITNVLMSLGIVRKVRRNNRQEFQWIGLEGFNAQ
jgi:transcription factor E2F7/8